MNIGKLRHSFPFFLGCLFEQQQQKNVYVSYLQATEYRSCLL